MKLNSALVARRAARTELNIVATTLKTSIGILLNSSKQPQAPAWHNPLKIAPGKQQTALKRNSPEHRDVLIFFRWKFYDTFENEV